jgi:hypothetical protein
VSAVEGDERRLGRCEQLAGGRALDSVAEGDPARGEIAHPTADAQQVVVARGLAVSVARMCSVRAISSQMT